MESHREIKDEEAASNNLYIANLSKNVTEQVRNAHWEMTHIDVDSGVWKIRTYCKSKYIMA